MKILSWNVNGLRSVFRNGFLDFVREYNPDVLCLQEIRVGEDMVESLKIEGYELYLNCANKKGYSGVAVYCKKKPLEMEFNIGFEKFDGEGRMIVSKFDDFVLVNFYLPHGGRDKLNLSYKLESYDFISDKLRDIIGRGEEVVVCGDFNIAREDRDLDRYKYNKNNIMFTPEERKKIGEFCDVGLRDSFREKCGEGGNYSWWPYLANCRERNIGWRIDYVFVSEGLDIREAFILKDVMGSDHCPVGVDVVL